MLVLKSTGLLIQEKEEGGMKFFDTCNRFNKINRLVVLWTVRHIYLAGARFKFNYYKNWVKLLLCHS